MMQVLVKSPSSCRGTRAFCCVTVVMLWKCHPLQPGMILYHWHLYEQTSLRQATAEHLRVLGDQRVEEGVKLVRRLPARLALHSAKSDTIMARSAMVKAMPNTVIALSSCSAQYGTGIRKQSVKQELCFIFGL